MKKTKAKGREVLKMTLENLSVRDMATLKWAVRVLRMEARIEAARSERYTKEEVIDECKSLDERLSAVLAEYYKNY